MILLEGFSKEKNAPIGTKFCRWLFLNSSTPTDTPFDFHKRLNVGAPYCSWFLRSDIFLLSNSCKKTWNRLSSSMDPNCWELAVRNRLFVCLLELQKIWLIQIDGIFLWGHDFFWWSFKILFDANCWDLPVRYGQIFTLNFRVLRICRRNTWSCIVIEAKVYIKWEIFINSNYNHSWTEKVLQSMLFSIFIYYGSKCRAWAELVIDVNTSHIDACMFIFVNKNNCTIQIFPKWIHK